MNKKLLKIGSAISILNLTTPIVTNATTYRSIYTTSSGVTKSRTMIVETTSSTPASVLFQLHRNRDLGRTTLLSANTKFSKGIEIVQPYNPINSNKLKFRHVYFPH